MQSLNWMPPWSSLWAVTQGCADMQQWQWCETTMSSLPHFVPFWCNMLPSNRNAAFGAMSSAPMFWYPTDQLALQEGWLQLSWTSSEFSGVNCFSHNFGPRSACLHATSLLNTAEQPKSVFNVRQKPSRWSLEYTASIWQGYQVLTTCFFFASASFPCNHFTMGCRNRCDLFSPVRLEAADFWLRPGRCRRVKAQGPSSSRSPWISLGSCEWVRTSRCSLGSLAV